MLPRHHIPQNHPKPNYNSNNTNNNKSPTKDVSDSSVDALVCTPQIEKQEKQEKQEPGTNVNHVAKKQKLEIARPTARHSPDFIAKLEIEQYMMEETLEGIMS